MDENIKIDGDGIYLRPIKRQDLDDHVAILNDWEVSKWLSNTTPFPYSKDDGEKFFDLNNKDYRGGNTVRFAIIEGETDRFIGVVKIFSLQSSDCEIGYWIGQDYWGKGYGSECLEKIIPWIKLSSNVKTLFAITAKENMGSQRILKKAGFEHKGPPPNEFAKCGNGVACSEFYELDLTEPQ